MLLNVVALLAFLGSALHIVRAHVTRPKIAHHTDCIAREFEDLLRQAFHLENSHLHIANFICNTQCAVALPQP